MDIRSHLYQVRSDVHVFFKNLERLSYPCKGDYSCSFSLQYDTIFEDGDLPETLFLGFGLLAGSGFQNHSH